MVYLNPFKQSVMNKKISAFLLVCLSLSVFSQKEYDIKFNIKNCPDTTVYLVRYFFDKQYITDTCRKVKNGVVRFKGKKELDKGVYTLVNQDKATYFDFLIDDAFNFTVNFDAKDIVNTLKSIGSKENENMFSYLKFMTNKNAEFNKYREETKGKSKQDSIKYITDKLKLMTEEVKKHEEDFMKKVKGTFVYDFVNLKLEKEAPTVPLASNGRPDSLYQYYYYKNHFWDEVNFTDDRILTVPFFDDRVKRYFDGVIYQYSPDTLINEIDKMLKACKPDGMVYNILLGHFTYKYEQDKRMGFDKIFVHLGKNYIVNGKANDVYTPETILKIKERVEIMENLLLESKATELYMIDTTDGKQVMKLGFDTVKTSAAATDLYYKHQDKLLPMFKTLYSIKAKYTVLVFWDVDCGHCQTEIPKLDSALKELKGKIDFKVFAVYTKEDYDKWRKWLINKKVDFINVFDPVHINNIKVKYDINSTPVIYILDKDKKIKGKKLGAESVPGLLNYLNSIDKDGK